MKNMICIKDLELGKIPSGDESKRVNKIFSGEGRQIIEITLRNGDVLAKHKAGEPITVLCLAGTGRFLAGADLDESRILRPGTLLTLEAEVYHEVVAEPELHILVTKFRGE